MGIDFTKYDKDFLLPADIYTKIKLSLPESDAFLLADVYRDMCLGYMESADIVCETVYSYAFQRNPMSSMMIGSMIRLYYHAVELITKAIGIKVNVPVTGHKVSIIFNRILNDCSDDIKIRFHLYGHEDEIQQIRTFLERCDKYNHGSEFGRYPVDNHGSLMDCIDGSAHDIRIMGFAWDIHNGISLMDSLYKNL